MHPSNVYVHETRKRDDSTHSHHKQKNKTTVKQPRGPFLSPPCRTKGPRNHHFPFQNRENWACRAEQVPPRRTRSRSYFTLQSEVLAGAVAAAARVLRRRSTTLEADSELPRLPDLPMRALYMFGFVSAVSSPLSDDSSARRLSGSGTLNRCSEKEENRNTRIVVTLQKYSRNKGRCGIQLTNVNRSK